MQEFSCSEIIYTQAILKGPSRLHIYIYTSISNRSDKVGHYLEREWVAYGSCWSKERGNSGIKFNLKIYLKKKNRKKINSQNNQDGCDLNSSLPKFSNASISSHCLDSNLSEGSAMLSLMPASQTQTLPGDISHAWTDIAKIVIKFYTVLKNNVPMVLCFMRAKAKEKIIQNTRSCTNPNCCLTNPLLYLEN